MFYKITYFDRLYSTNVIYFKVFMTQIINEFRNFLLNDHDFFLGMKNSEKYLFILILA